MTAEGLGFVKLSAGPEREALVTAFTVKDRDRSGFIEIAEAPSAPVLGGGDLSNIWIAHHDSDPDGKVSQSEFLAGSFLVFQGQTAPTGASNQN